MNSPIELRLPPHSNEAEHSVLGGLLIAGESAWDRVADMLSESDFYRDDHRRIFRHIALLAGAGKGVDVVTVYESIERSNEIDQTGGLAYLGEIANNTPSASNICHHAEIVRQRAVLRQLVTVGDQIASNATNPAGRTAETIASEAEARFAELFDSQADEPASLADAFGEAMRYIDARNEISELTTGFRDLDSMFGGLDPGQLIVIAARPAVGKTAFGLNVADHVARNVGATLFFSLEMSRREVAMRLLASRVGVSVHTMRTGTQDQGAWNRMSQATADATKSHLFIDDKPAIGVGYIRARARRLKRKHGLTLIVVDYIGLMRGSGENRTQEIGGISRGLKALAKELGVPIIALAQLNRGTENRQDKRPLLSDLRDSGEIEQDADIVVMLHRESIYNPSAEWAGVAEVLVRKNRNGPIGDVMLSWFPNEMLFTNHSGPNPRRGLSEPKSPPPSGRDRRGFDD